MTTDTALAIALLPRLHRANLCTDLAYENGKWFIEDTATGDDVPWPGIRPPQAIAYMAGEIWIHYCNHTKGPNSIPPLTKLVEWATKDGAIPKEPA